MPIELQTGIHGSRLALSRRGGVVVQRENFDGTQSCVGEYITTRVPTASVLALFATPYTILAAQGAGLAVVPTMWAIHKPAGTAYGTIGATDDMVLKYTNAAGAQCSGIIEATGFLDQATAQTRYAFVRGTADGATPSDVAPVANAAVVLHMLVSEVTTGTSDLYVRVWYNIIPTVFTTAD